MMDPIRRTILTTGVAATAAAAAGTRLFAQQTGQGGTAMGNFEKGAVRIHFEESGSRLSAAGDSRRRTELDDRRPVRRQFAFQPDGGVQGRVSLHHAGPAQRQGRPVLRPARGRPSLGCLHRRPSRADGSSRHQQVHGAWILHRRSLDLEPVEAGAGSRRRGRAGAAQRIAPGDARPVLRQATSKALGSGTDRQAARHHDGHGR